MSETDPLPTAQVTPPHLPQPSDARGAVERLAFEKVLKEESDYIKRRRTNIGQTSTPTSKDAFGLAFSGGGIRSASFNLGVLQAFAEKKLIGSLDYLSTVSGGGYIGSWLAAWVHRDGNIGRVENLLVPDRKANALVHRDFCNEDRNKSADYVFEDEPTPLYHLRAYSSFLTPKPGFLSVQSWTLFAIYLRNVFLNLLVIIPHRTTADQFFTESKFESFRKLGYEITKEMLESNACLVSSKTGFNDQSTRMPQAKLNHYLDEIAAYGSINLGPDWVAKKELFGQRYEELQSRLLSNRNLHHLREEIEQRTQLFQLIDRIESNIANDDKEILEKEKKNILKCLDELSRFERNEQEKNVEGKWIAKAIIVISDVFEAIKLKEYNPKLREGWIRIARRWMLTSSFQNHWKNLKEDFPIVMNEFYEKLKTDKYWNP